MTTGEKIVQIAPSLFEVCGENGLLREVHSIIWSSTAADQIDAMVEEAIRERLADVEAARKILEGKE